MEELIGVQTTERTFSDEHSEYEAIIKKELGIVVIIDNEDEFKGVFSSDGDVEVFKQLLSQKISDHYNKYNSIITNPAIPYKDDGDILFDFNRIAHGKMYGGYVYVVHYNFSSTAS